jgi:hypothetical protein
MYDLGYVFNYVIWDISIIPPTPQQGHNPNNYGMALMSAIPQAITPNPHTNLLNVQCFHKVHSGFRKIVARKQIELATCGLRQITAKLWSFFL